MGPDAMLSTEPVFLTAWIDDEGLVHLIEEAGPLTMSESSDVVRAIRFTAFEAVENSVRRDGPRRTRRDVRASRVTRIRNSRNDIVTGSLSSEASPG